jgi:hypothetical protein
MKRILFSIAILAVSLTACQKKPDEEAQVAEAT